MADWLPVACVCAAWFGGGIVSVVTGFGCGLFAMPIMLLCLPPEAAFPINIVLCCFSMFLILIKYWRNINYHHFLLATLSATPGAFIGIWILRTQPVELLETSFGIFLIIAATIEIFRKQILASHHPISSTPLEALFSFGAGIINGICGMGGPLLGVYASLGHWDKDMTRGTFGLFFGLNIFICALLLEYYGMLGALEFTYILWAIPCALAGTLAGIPLAVRVPQKLFLRLLLGVILVSGFVLILKSA